MVPVAAICEARGCCVDFVNRKRNEKWPMLITVVWDDTFSFVCDYTLKIFYYYSVWCMCLVVLFVFLREAQRRFVNEAVYARVYFRFQNVFFGRFIHVMLTFHGRKVRYSDGNEITLWELAQPDDDPLEVAK